MGNTSGIRRRDEHKSINTRHDRICAKNVIRRNMGKLTFEDARQYKLEKLEDALQEIASWTDAYPLEQFPEPDFAKVGEALAANGLRLGDVTASNMRHVVTRISEIAKEALKSEGI